jgi:hypothetical protein
MFLRVDVWKHAQEVLALFPASVSSSPAEPTQAAQKAADIPNAAQEAAKGLVAAGTSAIAHSAGPDLIAEAARAVLKLLLIHKQSGGAIPADVSELVGQLGKHSQN